jgi:hypothetical protein
VAPVFFGAPPDDSFAGAAAAAACLPLLSLALVENEPAHANATNSGVSQSQEKIEKKKKKKKKKKSNFSKHDNAMAVRSHRAMATNETKHNANNNRNIVANSVLSTHCADSKKKKKKPQQRKISFFFFFAKALRGATEVEANAAVARAAADCANAEVEVDAGRIALRDTKRLKRNIVDAFDPFCVAGAKNCKRRRRSENAKPQ